MAPFRVTRRRFLAWASVLAAAAGWRPKRAAAAPQPASALPQELLLALGSTVLPGELGADGVASAVRAFASWVEGYREDAEELHPYGSDDVSATGPSPAGAWRQQLVALDGAARTAHQRSFTSLGAAERQGLVRSALAGVRLAGLPAPQEAPHVAVALLSHFYRSPDATDLCYRARIRINECRPLATSGRMPLPLAGKRS